uniref:Tetratricopeptide repeat protein n=1 Tax=Thermus islandicus TaxID=540988 RepID=A0A831U523_9DEIN
MRKALILSFLSGALSFALAQASQVASLVDAGRFQEAYEAGVRLGTPEALALAAKAASFYALYQAKDEEKRAWFEKAERAASQAIAKAPDYPEGYFERARALGRLAQYKGVLEALAEGLAPRIRSDLERTLKLKPDHAGAMVALALWHFELVQKGWLVAATQGADGGRVEPLMRRAIELEPEAIIHRVEYARVLSAWGKREEARKQLEVALSLPARTAADRYDQERARKELSQLK